MTATALLAAALVALAPGPVSARGAGRRRAPRLHLRAAVFPHGSGPARALVTLRTPTPLRAPAPLRAPSSLRNGRVVFVTQKRVYLDRGAQDGLVLRHVVQLLRNGRIVGKCTLEIVGDHQAICSAAWGRIGDMFRLPAAHRTPHLRGARNLGGVVPEETLRERAEAIAAAPQEKVAFRPEAEGASPGRVTIAAGVTFWSAASPTEGPYAAEEIDVQLRHVPLGATGLRLDAAATAVRWQTRAGALRFRPDAPTQLYLWEAEVTRREEGDRTVFAVGRMWPWHVPGVPMLDGVQLGRRNETQTLEGGAYGGLLPAEPTLVPQVDAWAAGLYGAFVNAGSRGGLLRLVRAEARAGVRESPVVGLVNEGQLLGGVSLTTFGGDAGGRVRYAPSIDRQPVFEVAHVDLRATPAAAFGGWLQLRYVGAPPEQTPLLVNETVAVRGGYHAAFSANWDARPGLGVGVLGSAHVERGSPYREAEGGLELRLPALFGTRGGLWLGGTVADGWLRSRNAYVQVLGRGFGRLVVIGRLTGSTSEFATPSVTPNLTELGGYLQIDASLSARLHARARGLVRLPVLEQGLTPPSLGAALMTGIDIIMVL